MGNKRLVSPEEIEATTVCPSCGSDHVLVEETVALSSVRAAGDTRWDVEGAIKITHCIHGHCLSCGKMFEIIRRDIPVLYPSITCPTCESSAYMKLRIKELELFDETYQFTGTLECEECGSRLTAKLRKIIKELWKVTKIKISLTGVEVEKDKSDDKDKD